MVKNLGEQFALQWGHNALNGSHNLRQLWQHPFVDQAGDPVSIRQIVRDDFLKQLPGTDAVDIFYYAGQLDIRPLQNLLEPV